MPTLYKFFEPQPPGALRACPSMKWDIFTFTLITKGRQIFHKSRSRLKILGARRMTWSKFHAADPEEASVQNSVPIVSCRPEFVNSCIRHTVKRKPQKDAWQWKFEDLLQKSFQHLSQKCTRRCWNTADTSYPRLARHYTQRTASLSYVQTGTQIHSRFERWPGDGL